MVTNMATATQTAERRISHAATSESKPLDQAIEMTSQRQSLVGEAATVLGVPTNKLCDLLRNVWKASKGQPPLTDQEMFVGISLIARYSLDPIAKEIYVTRGKGGVFAIVSIDGWIKVLDRTDHYDGFDVVIHENESGTVDWVETCIYSTKRTHPTRYRAYMAEYSRVAGMVAQSIPTHMLRIFSLRHAARLFTPIGSTVLTEEEATYIARNEPEQRHAPSGIDDLTDRLSRPVQQVESEELPDTSYEPQHETAAKVESKAETSSFDQFAAQLAVADSISSSQAVYDHWFGPDSTEEFTPEQNTEALRLVSARQSDIRAARGPKSNGAKQEAKS